MSSAASISPIDPRTASPSTAPGRGGDSDNPFSVLLDAALKQDDVRPEWESNTRTEAAPPERSVKSEPVENSEPSEQAGQAAREQESDPVDQSDSDKNGDQAEAQENCASATTDKNPGSENAAAEQVSAETDVDVAVLALGSVLQAQLAPASVPYADPAVAAFVSAVAAANGSPVSSEASAGAQAPNGIGGASAAALQADSLPNAPAANPVATEIAAPFPAIVDPSGLPGESAEPDLSTVANGPGASQLHLSKSAVNGQSAGIPDLSKSTVHGPIAGIPYQSFEAANIPANTTANAAAPAETTMVSALNSDISKAAEPTLSKSAVENVKDNSAAPQQPSVPSPGQENAKASGAENAGSQDNASTKSHPILPAAEVSEVSAPASDNSLPRNPLPQNVVHVNLPEPVRALAATLNPASVHAATSTADNPVPLTGVALAIEIASRIREGLRRFDIRLDPPELGRIDVRLDVDRQGQATTKLTVDRPETLDLLQREARGLERALQSAGLKSGEGGLEFSLRYQGNDGATDQQSRQGSDLRPDLLVIEEVEPMETEIDSYSRAAYARGGVDIRI